ncbi:unnamed protein product [Leptosia nina]|uniref:Reverse transcriptase domain-containing protein n=1 Tax=Leptosia nina TaxID=320188 RepID=A0AAV1JFL2_9NEOP
MKRRNEAHNRARKTRDESHIQVYKELKYIVNTAIATEKKAYFDQYINKNYNNPRKLWKHLKNTINIQNKNDTPLPEYLSNPDEINDAFLNVPGSDFVSSSVLDIVQERRAINKSFKLTPINGQDVLKVLRSLHSNASGSDGISLDMLLSTLPDSEVVITKIINDSIMTNTFPSSWTESVVRPIPKNSNPSEVKDLRPISLLSCLSKVLEKIVSNQLTEFVEANSILPAVQSGFRKKRSTTTALLSVLDEILLVSELEDHEILGSKRSWHNLRKVFGI